MPIFRFFSKKKSEPIKNKYVFKVCGNEDTFLKEFQLIYNAVYQGETTIFKIKKNFDKMSLNQIKEHAIKYPDSRTAVAWRIHQNSLTQSYNTTRKAYLFHKIHEYAASHSGFISKTKNTSHTIPRSLLGQHGKRSNLIKSVLDSYSQCFKEIHVPELITGNQPEAKSYETIISDLFERSNGTQTTEKESAERSIIEPYVLKSSKAIAELFVLSNGKQTTGNVAIEQSALEPSVVKSKKLAELLVLPNGTQSTGKVATQQNMNYGRKDPSEAQSNKAFAELFEQPNRKQVDTEPNFADTINAMLKESEERLSKMIQDDFSNCKP